MTAATGSRGVRGAAECLLLVLLAASGGCPHVVQAQPRPVEAGIEASPPEIPERDFSAIELIVIFAGGDVVGDLGRVLTALFPLRIIPTEPKKFTESEETPCAVCQRSLGLARRGCSMEGIANQLTWKGRGWKELRDGDELLCPSVVLTPYEETFQFDERSPAGLERATQLQANWKDDIVSIKSDGQGILFLTVRGYRLKLKLASEQILDEAFARVAPLESRNVLLRRRSPTIADGARRASGSTSTRSPRISSITATTTGPSKTRRGVWGSSSAKDR